MKKIIFSLIIFFLIFFVAANWFDSFPKKLRLDIYYPDDDEHYGELVIIPLEKTPQLISAKSIHCSIKVLRDDRYGKNVRFDDEHYRDFHVYNKKGSKLGRVNGLLWPNFTSTEYVSRNIWKNPSKAEPILRY